MSSQYDNSMKGVLFRNEDKREGKRDPDYRGNGEVNGVALWIDAWINSSKDGRKYMSLQFKAKQSSGHQASAPRTLATAVADEPEFDDDIPF